jgi:BolA family transcriptional regulator, general stress-responsive regulator
VSEQGDPVDRNTRIERMRERLQILTPSELIIEDDSHRHAGHVGARDGRGHYNVRIVAAEFSGQSLLARHRRVYVALGDMMQTDIHALALDARAPEDAGN